MQITVTEKISVATTRENFPLSTRTLSSVSRFSKETLHLASIQRNYNSTRYCEFCSYIRSKIARYYVSIRFYVHPSNSSITFARTVFARIARFFSSTTIDFAHERFTLRTITFLHLEIFTGILAIVYIRSFVSELLR